MGKWLKSGDMMMRTDYNPSYFYWRGAKGSSPIDGGWRDTNLVCMWADYVNRPHYLAFSSRRVNV